jgi:hypothetical protein
MTQPDFLAAVWKVVDYLNTFLFNHADAITKNDDTYLRRQMTSISS